MAKRIPKTAIFIACEGKNTEPNYFERISEDVEDVNHLSITVYPDRREKANHKTNGIGLVKEAQSRAEEFDELYVVLDKDGYTKHDEVFALAAKKVHGKKIVICLSSIAFEHWVLLHFEKNKTAFSKAIDVIQYIHDKGYYVNYSKNAESDVYNTLKNRTHTAIEQAAWLRAVQSRTYGVLPPYQYSAYTDVDHLVKRLIGHSIPISWFGVSEVFTLSNFNCQLNLNESYIELQICNRGQISIVFNSENVKERISVYTQDEIDVEITIEETTVINPLEEKTLLLLLPLLQSQIISCRIELLFENHKAVIPLDNAF